VIRHFSNSMKPLFQAYDRWEEPLYEFQLGRRPFDPDGSNYGRS